MFALKHDDESGQEHVFHIDHVEPLSFQALRDCERDGRRTHPAVMHGRLCDGDGIPKPERVTLRLSVEFNERVPFYGLVPGGALPPPYLHRTSLVLDRNVVSSLRRRVDSKHTEALAELWSLGFLDSPGNTVNPVMGAFEGSQQRTPSLTEFRAEVEEAAEAIKLRLPSVKVTTLTTDVLRQLHEWRKSFDARSSVEAGFLKSVAPLLANRVASSQLEEVEREVLEASSACGLACGLTLVSVLAHLYESPDGVDGGAARRVLKLAQPYPDEVAYGALADLRQLELLVGSMAFPERFALLTGDRGLALLWCGLGAQEARVGVCNTHISLSPALDLFPRLPVDRRAGLLSKVIPALGERL